MRKMQIKNIKRNKECGYIIKEFKSVVLVRAYPKGYLIKNSLKDLWENVNSGIIAVVSGLFLLVYAPLELISNLLPRFYKKYEK